MTTQAQTHRFEAEVRQVLDLVIHSLYSHREVFLRELLSNASDALDKLRHEALTTEGLMEEGESLGIVLDPDAEAGVLRIADNGIGMSREDLVANLGTIASSGTRRFLDALREQGAQESPELIGRFGVGFYSVFMVADEVVVETRRAGTEEGWRWTSRGDGEFTIEPAEGLARGTVIALTLKPSPEGGGEEDDEDDPRRFLEPWTLRQLVRRWSDFVEYPIQMEVERPGEEGEEPTREIETLNTQKPLWTRPKDEVTTQEYEEFFSHLAGWGKPLETLHLRAEGTLEYTALLYVPEQAPFDLHDPARAKSRLSLYARRVRIQEECEELLPAWLRFVVGVVESSDLPLNVSRESIQSDARVRQIRKHLVRKELEALKRLLRDDRKAYEGFWETFGTLVKEGIWAGDDEGQRISELCLFKTSTEEGWRTLAEVKEAQGEDADSLAVLVAPDLRTALASPHLEAPRAAGREVLLFVDPVDEWMLQRLTEFDGTPLRQVDRGDSSLEGDDERKAREEKEGADKGFLDALRASVGEWVSAVRYSARLKETPAVLVGDEGAWSSHAERMLRRAGHELPASKRVLEVNPEHPLIKGISKLHGVDANSPRVAEAGEVLLGQALIREGQAPPDPARFATLVSTLLEGSLKG
jgi:molecular chaperone HtpG